MSIKARYRVKQRLGILSSRRNVLTENWFSSIFKGTKCLCHFEGTEFFVIPKERSFFVISKERSFFVISKERSFLSFRRNEVTEKSYPGRRFLAASRLEMTRKKNADDNAAGWFRPSCGIY